jgi:hypothetical protein
LARAIRRNGLHETSDFGSGVKLMADFDPEFQKFVFTE